MKKKVVALLGLALLPVTSVFAEEAKNVETNKLTTIEEKSANLKDVGENKLTKERLLQINDKNHQFVTALFFI